MTDGKLYRSLSANTIMAKLTNQFQRTRHINSSPDKHYSLDSEDDFRSVPSPGRSHYTNYWYSWVQTIYKNSFNPTRRNLFRPVAKMTVRSLGQRFTVLRYLRLDRKFRNDHARELRPAVCWETIQRCKIELASYISDLCGQVERNNKYPDICE